MLRAALRPLCRQDLVLWGSTACRAGPRSPRRTLDSFLRVGTCRTSSTSNSTMQITCSLRPRRTHTTIVSSAMHTLMSFLMKLLVKRESPELSHHLFLAAKLCSQRVYEDVQYAILTHSSCYQLQTTARIGSSTNYTQRAACLRARLITSMLNDNEGAGVRHRVVFGSTKEKAIDGDGGERRCKCSI